MVGERVLTSERRVAMGALPMFSKPGRLGKDDDEGQLGEAPS